MPNRHGKNKKQYQNLLFHIRLQGKISEKFEGNKTFVCNINQNLRHAMITQVNDHLSYFSCLFALIILILLYVSRYLNTSF